MDTHEFVEKARAKLESLKSRSDHPYDDDHEHDLYSSKMHHGAPNMYTLPRVTTAAAKPAIFDGSTPWQDYVVHFEIVSQLNGWHNNRDKAMHLASCLRGPAQAVLGDLNTHDRFSYEVLTKALKRRFCLEDKAELNRTLLKNRRRKNDETLPELAQSLRRLAKSAYPDAPYEVQDSLAKDQFLDAINDANLRWQIFQMRPKTLDNALESAVEIEAFRAAENQRRFVRQIHSEASSEKEGKVNTPITENKNDLLKQLVCMLQEIQNRGQRKTLDPPPQNVKHSGNEQIPGSRVRGRYEG